MDTLTHAGIGVIAAAPFLDSCPELALGLVAGSVLPDLDAFSRIFGKVTFLRLHQTWSHAFLVQGLISVGVGWLVGMLGMNGAWAALGTLVGFAGHTLLDLTNTLGVMLFAPFSRRRFRLEWVFFIDAVVMMATGLAVMASVWELRQKQPVPGWYAAVFFSAMAAYFFAKGGLRRHAGRLAPSALSLVPSAFVPWRFYGTIRDGGSVRLFQINAITGGEKTLGSYTILDAEYLEMLRPLPEFKVMCEFSPVYHVVRAVVKGAGKQLSCRDLRIRNFGSTFGDLDVMLDDAGKVQGTHFHV